MTRIYLIAKPYYWGKGETFAEAMKNCKVKKDDSIMCFVFDVAKEETGDVYIDELGIWHAPSEPIYKSLFPNNAKVVADKVFATLENK
jgi:hypothetical protein